MVESYPPSAVGRQDASGRLPLNPIFLVIFDQFIAVEEVMKTVSIHVGSNLKWEKKPASFGSLRLVDRDSPDLEYL